MGLLTNHKCHAVQHGITCNREVQNVRAIRQTGGFQIELIRAGYRVVLEQIAWLRIGR